MDRLTDKKWQNLAYVDYCGNAPYCDRECHFDEECVKECTTPKIYKRLAEYEDSGLTPDEVQALVNELKNEPLTLEELIEMHGKPVWAELLENTTGSKSGWTLVYFDKSSAACQRWTNWTLWYAEYGKTWTAYRHKKDG